MEGKQYSSQTIPIVKLLIEDLSKSIFKKLPPTCHEVEHFSGKRNQEMTTAMVNCIDFNHGKVSMKMKEDEQVKIVKHKIRNSNAADPEASRTLKQSEPLKCETKKDDQGMSNGFRMQLVPLLDFDDNESRMGDEPEVEEMLRERKLHAEYYRNKLEANMKVASNVVSRIAKNQKGEKSTLQAIYHHDGSIIQGRQETTKQPHFVSVQSSVKQNHPSHQEDQDKKATSLKSKSVKNNPKTSFKCANLPSVKAIEFGCSTHFTREVDIMSLSTGVRFANQREAKQNSKKFGKIFEMLKSSNLHNPPKCRLKDLLRFKESEKSSFTTPNEQANNRSFEAVSRLEGKLYQPRENRENQKIIKVVNSKALEALLDQEGSKACSDAYKDSTKSAKKTPKSVYIKCE